jgi:ABC-type glutathione transport system ATPase component
VTQVTGDFHLPWPPSGVARRRGALDGRHRRTAQDIVKVYGQGETAVHALRGVSLAMEEGDYVAVMGASGSGKPNMGL